MDNKYLSLLIDFVLLAIVVVASLHPKFPFYKHWKKAGAGLLATVIFFILWVELFAHLGIWSFDERFTIGVHVGWIPLEEVLFLVIVIYTGMFVYFALNQISEKDRLFPHQEVISSVLIIVLLIAGLYYKEKVYTGAAFLLLAIFLTFQMLKLRPRYMGRFYSTFALLFIPLLIVDGFRTGAFVNGEIVHYNDEQNLNLRLGTIPLENICFVFLLMVMPVTIWEWLEDYFYYRSR
ncbi:lycopene cyclase domain-containing protein [Chryseolinea sp. T2]|uniref:lycopene cyclase domain-containing protein n=1 Tax=Chryseolinea sp. T2 TaxID=3129255 RepID=UPI003077CEA1